MILLWIFWVEILAFSVFAVWSLWQSSSYGPLSGYQWADAVIYGGALMYGLYGFIRFLGRHLRPPGSEGSI